MLDIARIKKLLNTLANANAALSGKEQVSTDNLVEDHQNCKKNKRSRAASEMKVTENELDSMIDLIKNTSKEIGEVLNRNLNTALKDLPREKESHLIIRFVIQNILSNVISSTIKAVSSKKATTQIIKEEIREICEIAMVQCDPNMIDEYIDMNLLNN